VPFDEGHLDLIAKQPDGSDADYCIDCYADGTFIDPDATVADMIELGVPHLARKIGEPAARQQLAELVPSLARWKDMQHTVL